MISTGHILLKRLVNYDVTDRVSICGSFRYLSGVPKTLETSIKSFYYYDPITNNVSTFPSYVTENKNNARLPAYIQLDLGLIKELRKGFGSELAEFLHATDSFFSISFENLLFFRRNVMMYLPSDNKEYFALGSNYLPGISVGYTIKF